MLSLVPFFSSHFAANAAPATLSCKVLSCNDGDTCKLECPSEDAIKVRLVGIDAPETRGKKKYSGRQPLALEAKAFLNEKIQGKQVTLISYSKDLYGRVLGDLLLDGKSVNIGLVENGLAECYRGKPPSGYSQSACDTAQEKAKTEKRGIWSLENYQSPKDFRKKK
jgi:endonuclease YncB( thermonuclease family)